MNVGGGLWQAPWLVDYLVDTGSVSGRYFREHARQSNTPAGMLVSPATFVVSRVAAAVVTIYKEQKYAK